MSHIQRVGAPECGCTAVDCTNRNSVLSFAVGFFGCLSFLFSWFQILSLMWSSWFSPFLLCLTSWVGSGTVFNKCSEGHSGWALLYIQILACFPVSNPSPLLQARFAPPAVWMQCSLLSYSCFPVWKRHTVFFQSLFRVGRLISALGLNQGSWQFPLSALLEHIGPFHFTERQICSYCSLARVCIMKQSWPGYAGRCSKEVLPASITMAEG